MLSDDCLTFGSSFIFIQQIFINYLLCDGNCSRQWGCTNEAKVVSANKEVLLNGEDGQISYNSNRAMEWCL